MELTNIKVIKSLATKYGFSFTKSLGQNFIINPTVCPKMAKLGGCDKETVVIEIGCGFGVLTKELATLAEKVLVIEIDTALKPVIEEVLAEFSNVEIIYSDILKLNLKAIIAEKFPNKRIIVCANLPYYITSPVIMKLLEDDLPIYSITVMVQEEAATRICAKLGTRECGAISVAINYYGVPEVLFKVSRGSFMPSPNVDSAVIKVTLNNNNAVEDKKLFFRIIRCLFSERRKQIINPLSNEFGMPKDFIANLLLEANVPPTKRPEALTMQQFIDIYRIFCKKCP